MIAVWLVGPPRSVTSAMHPLGVQAGRVGRREVGGDEHARLLGHRYAGLRLADDPGHHPALDVAQVGDPLGHQAPHAGEHGHERLDRRLQRGQQVVAGLSCLSTADRSPLSRASPALAVSTSAAAPEARCGLGGEPLGDGGGDLVVPREGVVLGERGAVERVDGCLGDLGPGEQDRAVGDAGHDRRAGQGARLGRGGRRGHGHKLLPSPP